MRDGRLFVPGGDRVSHRASDFTQPSRALLLLTRRAQLLPVQELGGGAVATLPQLGTSPWPPFPGTATQCECLVLAMLWGHTRNEGLVLVSRVPRRATCKPLSGELLWAARMGARPEPGRGQLGHPGRRWPCCCLCAPVTLFAEEQEGQTGALAGQACALQLSGLCRWQQQTLENQSQASCLREPPADSCLGACVPVEGQQAEPRLGPAGHGGRFCPSFCARLGRGQPLPAVGPALRGTEVGSAACAGPWCPPQDLWRLWAEVQAGPAVLSHLCTLASRAPVRPLCPLHREADLRAWTGSRSSGSCGVWASRGWCPTRRGHAGPRSNWEGGRPSSWWTRGPAEPPSAPQAGTAFHRHGPAALGTGLWLCSAHSDDLRGVSAGGQAALPAKLATAIARTRGSSRSAWRSPAGGTCAPGVAHRWIGRLSHWAPWQGPGRWSEG